MEFVYPAKLTPDENGRYLVTFRDVAEALTDGATIEEALVEAEDALDGALLGYVDDARFPRPIPEPSKKQRGEYLIRISPRSAAKLALHHALRQRKISVRQLAKMLGVSDTAVRRLLDPNYRSNFDKLLDALAIVGRKVEIGVWEVA
ncbi:MAG: type II toxin-antitoxin system HicB family antitoxin [Geminicoccaceae bacterium]